jgi:multiple sugar transport system substrate-binding protein
MPEPIALRGITWDHDRGLRPLVATAAAYAERASGIRVDWEVRSLQAFADEPVDVLAARFDLIVLDHPSTGTAVERGCIARLDERLDRVDRSFLEDQRRNSVGRSYESYVWDGALWALPIDAAAQVASYRPDVLERLEATVPETWDDVFALAHAMRGTKVYVAMPSIPVDAVLAYCASAVADGVDPFNGDLTSRARALERLRELVALAHPGSTTWNPPRLYEHMASADDVAYCPLAFGYSNYARPGYRARPLAFAPAPASRSGVRVGTLGGAGIAVSASSPNAGEAIRYAAFVASPAIQRRTYVRADGQPAHRSAWLDDDANAMTKGYFRATLPGLDAAYLRPRHAGFLEFQERAGDLVHGYLTERGSAPDVIDRLDATYAETRGRTGT